MPDLANTVLRPLDRASRQDPGTGETPESAITNLIERDYPRLVGVVAVTCGSTPVAEDAVQDALVKAWERACRGEVFEHLAGWVVVVAINQARQSWRRSRAEQRAVDRLGDRQGRGEADHEAILDLQRAVAALPGRQREVVVLHYLLGMDVATTATVLGISQGTVKNGLFRARAALASRLGRQEGTQEGPR